MGAMLVSAPAAAQPRDLGLRADTLGIPADTVRLPVERVNVACNPIGVRVVRDTADLRAVERFPGCEAAEFPALGRDLYVHLVMAGNCGGRDRVDAYRSTARREYRLVLVAYHHGCRGLRVEEYWVRLPPLPEGWTVGFTVITRRRPEEPSRTVARPADSPSPSIPG
ncbi:hypothetical protein [Longimicrobium sp.]|uniref:hypothetical protein n=1 Tax=Longimicrobium sp. TaxID=2029185 RepID=UPI003B3AB9FA